MQRAGSKDQLFLFPNKKLTTRFFHHSSGNCHTSDNSLVQNCAGQLPLKYETLSNRYG